MCGIIAIVNYTGDSVDESILRLMADSLQHRGPDDEGFFLDKSIGLGHKRLSIIDISTGHQPMCNENGNLWIIYNGEIYNYQELRLALQRNGHIFQTHSDTEVILHAYEQYGDDCVSFFNGMFSFIIYDKQRKRIFGARDRLGIKPLYYYSDDKVCLFASEIKALLKHPEINISVNNEGINDYLAFQFCIGDKTLFTNVKKILPGYSFSCIINNPKSFKVKQYWDISYSIDTYHTEDYFIDTLTQLIEDSVRVRLRSDVEVGSYLSGGLDSSTLTMVASKLLKSGNLQMKTFTGGFKEFEGYDESQYAKIVSEQAETHSFNIYPTASDFIASLPKLIYFMDEPAAGPGLFPQYCVSKCASENVKVVIGGQGGDEIFGGYARYLVAYLEQCLKGAIFMTQEEGKHVVTLDSIVPNLPLLQQYQPLIEEFWKTGLFEPMENRYFQLVYRGAGYNNLLHEQWKIDEDKAFRQFLNIFSHADTLSYLNKMSYFDLKASLPALLHVEDRASMSVSLESRLPLLDYRIVELMASVPPTIKFKGGETKYLFKKAVRNIVPGEVLNRQDKMGFPVPLSEWYQDELKGFVLEHLLSDIAKERRIYDIQQLESSLHSEKKFGRGIWGLLCLELWFKEFIDDRNLN